MDAEEQLAQARHDELLRAIEGIHERLDTLNGRTREVEKKVAVIEASSSQNPPGKATMAGISALIAGAIAGLAQLLGSMNQ